MSATLDSTLADPQHIIADLRRELAECRSERDEALAQQSATAEVLGVINSSPGDLIPVFDAMLEKATRLCDAPSGIFWIFDGEFSRATATRGIPDSYAEYLRQLIPLDPATGLGRVRQGERVAVSLDLAEEEPYRAGNPQRLALVDLGRARSAVRVPLIKDSKLLGIITLYRQEIRPFSDKQITLLQNFAAQAVIAMENARLLSETRKALEQQAATAEVLRVINSSPGDLSPVFDAILEKATQVCEAAFGVMNTYDGERFHTAAMHRLPHALAEMYRRDPPPPGPHSPLTLIARGQDVVSIDDLTVGPGADLPRRRILIEQGGARSWVAVALRKDGALLGAICAYRSVVRPFTN